MKIKTGSVEIEIKAEDLERYYKGETAHCAKQRFLYNSKRTPEHWQDLLKCRQEWASLWGV